MEGKDLFNKSMIRTYLLVTIIYLTIILVTFGYITFNIVNRITINNQDTLQSLWNLWWVQYATFNLHILFYNTNLLYHPIGASLVTDTIMPLAGLLTAPLQLISLGLAYNVIFFLGYVLSGFFMFLLAYYITGNKYAAFIAGLVFAFSPIHIIQSYFHLDWTSIEFIPLFILFLFLSFKENKNKWIILAAISFLFLTFFGDIEQGIMTLVFIMIFLFYTCLTLWNKEKIKKELINLIKIALVTVLIGLPFFIPILYAVIFQHALALANQDTGIIINIHYSNDLLAFFIPDPYNRIIFPFFSNYSTIYQPDLTSKVAYIGFTVILLVAIALILEFRKDKLKENGIWLFITIVFAILSLGPIVFINSINTNIPSIYLIYRLIPILNIIREPGRFDVFATVGLAVLCSIGINGIYKIQKLEKNKKNNTICISITVLLSSLILFEYIGAPFQSSPSTGLLKIPPSYYSLSNDSCNCSVLLLPDLPIPHGSNFYPGLEMYYQTVFKKPIIGGYLSRTNTSELVSVTNIPLSIQSKNLETNAGFIFSYPINENYTTLSLYWIRNYNIGFVGVVMSAYNNPQLVNYLSSIFGTPTYFDNKTEIFSTNSVINRRIAYAIAYVNGTWIESSSICPNSHCSGQYSSLWWGNNTRYIIIYEPSKSTNIAMSFNAISYYGLPLNLYLDNATRITLNMSNTVESYRVNLTLHNGLNYLTLYMQNSSSTNSTNYYRNFGIKNITFISK